MRSNFYKVDAKYSEKILMIKLITTMIMNEIIQFSYYSLFISVATSLFIIN